MDAMITEPFNCLTDCLILCVRNCLAIVRCLVASWVIATRPPRPSSLRPPQSSVGLVLGHSGPGLLRSKATPVLGCSSPRSLRSSVGLVLSRSGPGLLQSKAAPFLGRSDARPLWSSAARALRQTPLDTRRSVAQALGFFPALRLSGARPARPRVSATVMLALAQLWRSTVISRSGTPWRSLVISRSGAQLLFALWR